MNLEPTSEKDPSTHSESPSFSTVSTVVDCIPDSGPLLIILDKDGTLDEKVVNRDSAKVSPATIHQIMRLQSLTEVDVVVIRGRSVGELKELIGTLPVRYYGLHGAEGGNGDERELFLASDHSVQRKVGQFSESFRLGLRDSSIWTPEIEVSVCEEKEGKGFAAHWRAHPEIGDIVQGLFIDTWQNFLHSDEFQIQQGDCVIEVKLPASKGDALLHYLNDKGTSPHATRHILVVGDDETDLSMMKIAQSSTQSVTPVIIESLHLHIPNALYLPSPKEVLELLTRVADKRSQINDCS